MNSLHDNRIAQMYCEKCASQVDIEEVVWYQNNYVAPGTLPQEDNVPFSDGVYILPGA
ncbi:hypothetical protein [Izhakiella capsodis]|nr:hypothetical protein [Izhakiella capsodis]